MQKLLHVNLIINLNQNIGKNPGCGYWCHTHPSSPINLSKQSGRPNIKHEEEESNNSEDQMYI